MIGSHLGGGDERFGSVVGSGAVKVFDMNVSLPVHQKTAEDAGFDVGVAWGSLTDKTDYYPDRESPSEASLRQEDDQTIGASGLQQRGSGQEGGCVASLQAWRKA